MRKVSLYAVCIIAMAANAAFLDGRLNSAAGQSGQAVAEDFTLQDLEQVRFYSLSSYRNKQPVLLFFWTTWCPFCQKALKSLSMMHEELKEQGVVVFAINIGESPSKVRHAVRYYKAPFTVLLDENSATVRSYNLLGVPTYVLVDRDGAVVFRDNYLPARKLSEFLKGA